MRSHNPGPRPSLPVEPPRGRASAARLALLLALALSSGPAIAAKTDVVIMKNGDHLTGEVESLSQGLLQLSTDDMGTLEITWDRIDHIVSTRTMQVQTRDGTRYYGTLDKSDASDRLLIQTSSGPKMLELKDVVHVRPIEKSFWKQLDGSFSLGGSYTKSSDVFQASFSGDVSQRTRKNILRFNVNAINTTQTTGTTQQIQANFNHQYLWKRRIFSSEMAAYQRNQETGIQNRILVGGGAGRWLMDTNRQALSLSGGLDVNFEDTTGIDGGNTSLEGFIGIDYAAFRHHTPKQNLSITLFAFPGLTEWGRLRGQGNVQWRQEIVNDFYFELSVYITYDNEPPEGALSTNDYGIVTSLGYSF